MTIVTSAASVGLPAQMLSRADSVRAADRERSNRKPFSIGIALGPGISLRKYSQGLSGTRTSFALAGGLFRGSRVGGSHAGFLPAFKLSLRPAKVDVVASAVAGAPVLQTLKLQAQMAGLGWSAPITNELFVKFSAIAGRSFNGLESGGSTHDARILLSPQPSSVDDNFAWETTARVWKQVSPRVSLIAGVSFQHSRPALHFLDNTTQAFKADQVHFDAGVAYTLFQYTRKQH